MFSLLSSIVNTIISLVTFFVHTLESFADLFEHLPDYQQFMFNSLNLLPSSIIPFALLSVSIYIVLFIIGRN